MSRTVPTLSELDGYTPMSGTWCSIGEIWNPEHTTFYTPYRWCGFKDRIPQRAKSDKKYLFFNPNLRRQIRYDWKYGWIVVFVSYPKHPLVQLWPHTKQRRFLGFDDRQWNIGYRTRTEGACNEGTLQTQDRDFWKCLAKLVLEIKIFEAGFEL